MRAVRPRYEERFDVSTETALARAKVMLTAEGGPFEGNVLDRFVDIHIRQADRHFWSPWLNVEVEPLEGEQTGCFVHGRFGPHPNVWTLFMMLYGVLSMLSFAALMWGLSKLMAGEYAWFGKGPQMSWTYTSLPDAFHGATPAFNNSGDDSAAILNNTEILDQTGAYLADAMGNGASWQLDANSLDAVSNDDINNWCYSTMNFGNGDLGTPGAVNEACP